MLQIWTHARVDLLKQLWGNGLKAHKIAAEIGGVTRNAVIGKAHRLGLVNQKKNGLKVHAEEQKLHQIRSTKKHRPRVQLLEDRFLPPTPIPAGHPDDLKIPLHQRRTLIELHNYACRWPLGDPQQPGFAFCGGAADLSNRSPYCTLHSKRAFVTRG